jgi:hypothetical protein
MNFFKKFIVSSLVVALVSFAGSFCVHPMAAEADSMGMENGLQCGSEVHDTDCISELSNQVSPMSACNSDCVTSIPQTINAEKVVIAGAHNFIFNLSDDQPLQVSEIAFGTVVSTGTHPPSPDILSSVVKIE